MEEKKKVKVLGLVIIILGVSLVIVGGIMGYKLLSKTNDVEEPAQEEKPHDMEKAEEESKKEEKKVKIIDVDSKTRPYAIMINCHNDAFPQSGLQDAYIVYELMVEYGITRMMALFKDVNFDKVGSIRSVRNQYIGYAFENDAVIVHAGGSEEAIKRLQSEGISNINVDGKYGQRDKELAKKRAWEHTLFTKSDSLKQAVDDKNIRTTTEQKTLLTYSSDELDLSKYQTTPANKVSIKYSSYRTSVYDYDANSKTFLRSIGNKKNTDLVTGEQYKVSIKYSSYRTSVYDYDLNSKTFLRSIGNKKNTDLVTGEQYKVKNIIVYAVKHSTYGGAYQKLSNIGTGEGYYITDGVALPIIWEKKDEKSQTVYKIKETGEDLIVNDGNTYIQIYPSNGGKLTIS